ncbi:MAG: hypothetical protein ACM3ZR_08955 [Pseudomonadota bacterium]
MKIKVGKLIEEMNSNIQLDIKPVRVITAIAFAVALPFYFNAYGHRSQFASLAYYFILFGLCMANYSTLCGFLGLPSLKGKLPSFSGSSLDTFFAYPLLLTALISIINSLLVATGTVPQDAQNLASYKLGLVQLFF